MGFEVLNLSWVQLLKAPHNKVAEQISLGHFLKVLVTPLFVIFFKIKNNFGHVELLLGFGLAYDERRLELAAGFGCG